MKHLNIWKKLSWPAVKTLYHRLRLCSLLTRWAMASMVGARRHHRDVCDSDIDVLLREPEHQRKYPSYMLDRYLLLKDAYLIPAFFEELPCVWRFADGAPCSVFPVFDGSMRQGWKCKQKLSATQQLNAISNRQRQHPRCIVSMVTDAPSDIYVYYEDSLSTREVQRYRKKSFGIIHSASISVPTLYSVFRYTLRYHW